MSLSTTYHQKYQQILTQIANICNYNMSKNTHTPLEKAKKQLYSAAAVNTHFSKYNRFLVIILQLLCKESPAKVNSSAKFRKLIDMEELILIKPTEGEQKSIYLAPNSTALNC